MYLIRGLHNLGSFNAKDTNNKYVATIGNFDGLHLGHQALIKAMKTKAKDHNAKTMVFFYRASCSRVFC